MAEKLDMSLDDIIKKEGIKARRPGVKSAANRKGPGGRPGIGGRNQGKGARNAPYARKGGPRAAADSKWQHDRFEGRVGPGSGPAQLMVSNLDFGVSDTDIKELFSSFGGLKKAAIHYDKSGRSLGVAEITFTKKQSAILALNKYNGMPLDGRPMKIQLVTQAGQVAAAARGENSTSQRTGATRQNSNPKGQQKRQGQAPQKKKELTAEQLDADLDAFISKTN